VSIQSDGTMLCHSIEEILRDVDDSGISVMRFVRKPVHGRLYCVTLHHVVKDEQMTGTQIGHKFLVLRGNFRDKGHGVV
jgi:hypothetical protein